jgi:ubiquinone/menaquinone biosynthesis C-methylase UbiE
MRTCATDSMRCRARPIDVPKADGTVTGSTEEEPVTGATAYATTWLADESLESISRRIHDGVPDERLMERARGYRDWLFDTYPAARPDPETRVMELGSGVGWIMEAVLERFAVREIVGVDISDNMVKRAQERFSHPDARFVVYDGFHVPFEDGYFGTIYSVAAMQHIEKHVAFLLFEELYRLLAVGGHAVIHLLAVDHIPEGVTSYREECWNHVRNVPTHWHHYYSFDELFVLFSQIIGVDDLDITYQEASRSFLVHFSKATGNPYFRSELPTLTFAERVGAGPGSTPPVGSNTVAEIPPPTTSELGLDFAHHLFGDARALAGRARAKFRSVRSRQGS